VSFDGSTSSHSRGMIFLLCSAAIATSCEQTSEPADDGLTTKRNASPLTIADSISILHCALGGIPSQSTHAVRPFSTSASYRRVTKALSLREEEMNTSVVAGPPPTPSATAPLMRDPAALPRLLRRAAPRRLPAADRAPAAATRAFASTRHRPCSPRA